MRLGAVLPLARRYASAVLAMALFLCVSVRLICLSQLGILSTLLCSAKPGCRVAQLVECLVTSGYPDGSSSGGPGSYPGENENFWKIPRIT